MVLASVCMVVRAQHSLAAWGGTETPSGPSARAIGGVVMVGEVFRRASAGATVSAGAGAGAREVGDTDGRSGVPTGGRRTGHTVVIRGGMTRFGIARGRRPATITIRVRAITSTMIRRLTIRIARMFSTRTTPATI